MPKPRSIPLTPLKKKLLDADAALDAHYAKRIAERAEETRLKKVTNEQRRRAPRKRVARVLLHAVIKEIEQRSSTGLPPDLGNLVTACDARAKELCRMYGVETNGNKDKGTD